MECLEAKHIKLEDGRELMLSGQDTKSVLKVQTGWGLSRDTLQISNRFCWSYILFLLFVINAQMH